MLIAVDRIVSIDDNRYKLIEQLIFNKTVKKGTFCLLEQSEIFE